MCVLMEVQNFMNKIFLFFLYFKALKDHVSSGFALIDSSLKFWHSVTVTAPVARPLQLELIVQILVFCPPRA